MFFKKKAAKGPVPVEDVQALSRKGLSDREIIKKLKKEGYAYEDIERSMLQAVKAGVAGEPAFDDIKQTTGDSFSLDELYEQPTPQQAPQQEPTIDEDAMSEAVNAETLIEELIEGVIEEKWEQFTKKIKEQEQNLEKIETMIR